MISTGVPNPLEKGSRTSVIPMRSEPRLDAIILGSAVSSALRTLRPRPINPKTLDPRPLNPKPCAMRADIKSSKGCNKKARREW